MAAIPTQKVRRKSDGAECVINREEFNEHDYEEIAKPKARGGGKPKSKAQPTKRRKGN